jgi:hypothetical protein
VATRQQQGQTFPGLSRTCKAFRDAVLAILRQRATLRAINDGQLSVVKEQLQALDWWQLAYLTLLGGEAATKYGTAIMQHVGASAAAARLVSPVGGTDMQLPLRGFSMSSGVGMLQPLGQDPAPTVADMFPRLELLEVHLALETDAAKKAATTEQQLGQLAALTQCTGLTSLLLRSHLGEGGPKQAQLPTTLVDLCWQDNFVPEATEQLSRLSSLRRLSLRHPVCTWGQLGGVLQLTWVQTLTLGAHYITPAWFSAAALAFLAPRLVDLELSQVEGGQADLLTRLTALSRLTALRMPQLLKLVPEGGNQPKPGSNRRVTNPQPTWAQLEGVSKALQALPSLKFLQLNASKTTGKKGNPLIQGLSGCASLQQLQLMDADRGLLGNRHLCGVSLLTRLQLSTSAHANDQDRKKPGWYMTLQHLTGLVCLEVQSDMLEPPNAWVTGLTRLHTLSVTRPKRLSDAAVMGSVKEAVRKAAPSLQQVVVLITGEEEADQLQEQLAALRAVRPGVCVVVEPRSEWWLRNTQAH